MKKAYYAVFVADDNDNGKVSVVFPDIPGCFTWGENMEHAFSMAIDALENHLEALADDGDSIPEPSERNKAWAKFEEDCTAMNEPVPTNAIMQMIPAPDLDKSPVRVNVSIKRYLLERIDRKAAASGMTRSGFLIEAAKIYEARR